MTRRIHSFVWGGLLAAVVVVFGIYNLANGGQLIDFAITCGIAVCAFTFLSCLILANNFVGEMVVTIFTWGFVSWPGLIFELSLDGIIWLLTVKLVMWILGIIIAALFGILGIIFGALISIFVYPFALYKNINGGDD